MFKLDLTLELRSLPVNLLESVSKIFIENLLHFVSSAGLKLVDERFEKVQ